MRVTGIWIVTVVQRGRRQVETGRGVRLQLDNGTSARLFIFGYQCPPVSFVPRVVQRIKSESVVRVIRTVGTVCVYSKPRLVEEGSGTRRGGPDDNVPCNEDLALFASLMRNGMGRLRNTWKQSRNEQNCQSVLHHGVIHC